MHVPQRRVIAVENVDRPVLHGGKVDVLFCPAFRPEQFFEGLDFTRTAAEDIPLELQVSILPQNHDGLQVGEVFELLTKVPCAKRQGLSETRVAWTWQRRASVTTHPSLNS